MRMLSTALAIAVSFVSLTVKADPMKVLPKPELHIHLGGAFPYDYVLSIASEKQKEELVSNFRKISEGVDYSKVFDIFPIISQIVNTEEKIENGTKALCEWLAEDGVSYVEIRTGLKNLGKGYEEYLVSVLKGMSSCASKGVTARLLLSLQRNSPVEIGRMTVDLALKYQKDGIVGLDLSGDSTLGNLEEIASEFLRAKKSNLFLTIHIGESPKESQQLELLRLLGPDRVGHGVHLSQAAKDWILSQRIPIEVCLSSSQQVKMIQSYKQHPGFEFFRAGHPITLGTDDPLIFRSALSDEYKLFQKETGLTDQDMAQIARQGFDFAFISKEEKENLKSSLERYF